MLPDNFLQKVSGQRAAATSSSTELPRIAFISSLPDEILSEVFSYHTPMDEFTIRAYAKEGDALVPKFAITFVCKRWRRVYERILFHKISFDKYNCRHPEDIPQRVQNLPNLLDARPLLRRFPQEIRIVYLAGPIVARNVTRIIELCSALRKIKYQNEFTNDSWPLLNAIRSRPLLEDLTLTGGMTGPSIYLILQCLDIPRLKHLHLNRYGPGKDDRDCGGPNQYQQAPAVVTQQSLDTLLPLNQYGIRNNLKSMYLTYPNTHAHVTAQILRLPYSLEKLAIPDFCDSPARQSYDINGIQQILNVQRHSLKEIRMGEIPNRDPAMVCLPDFSDFPHLEKLEMNARDIMRYIPADLICRIASAPRLHSFCIDYSPHDLFNNLEAGGYNFGSTQFAWMKDFSSILSLEYPESKLARFEIVGIYVGLPRRFQDGVQPSWPYEYLERAKCEIAEKRTGLVSVCYELSYTREEWEANTQQILADQIENKQDGSEEEADGQFWD